MVNIKTGWLTITRKCNNACDWCYTKNKLNCQSMNYEDAITCVDKLDEMGVKRIVLIGGEPTLYSNFIDLISYISSRGIKVSVATNGRKLADKKFAKEVVDAGVNSINISLKGVSEEEYKKYTHSFGLEEAIIGYKNLQRLNFKNVSLSYVIVDDDKEKFNKLVLLLEKNRLKNILFQFVKPVLELRDNDDILDIQKMGNFISYIYHKMKKTRLNYCLEVSFPLCAIESDVLQNMINENRIITCCHVPSGKGVIFDTDFKVLPCNHFAEYPYSEEKIGLKSSKEICEFLDSDVCNKLRAIARTYPSEKCMTCNIWNICGGGCFTRWFYQKPDEIIPCLKGGEEIEIK